MWKLKAKPGNSLIEVMASLSIFSILFFAAMSIELSSIKIKQYNKVTNKYTEILEGIKCKLIFNTTYEEIKLLGNENKVFIVNENLEFEKIKDLEIQNLFSHDRVNGNNFIKLIITNENSVIKILVELHYLYNNKDNIIKSEFYKGNYLWKKVLH